MGINLDPKTVRGFAFEWTRFNQGDLAAKERERIFDTYFSIFPWSLLPADGGTGADIGCGSGRWAVCMARRVARLHLVDASAEALHVTRQALREAHNVSFHLASVDALPFENNSLDFCFSLGVLHHVPDTAAAIRSISEKLKPGAPLLVYLYYALDNRPRWYRWIWKGSDLTRRVLSRLPEETRYLASQVLAAVLYWPLARSAALLDRAAKLPANYPLAQYRHSSYYVMRTDALDRLGTRLEKRFTRAQIKNMLESAGFVDVRFSDAAPYWCAVGIKAPAGLNT
jgi:ubiquinone/menaquinone biosynthesis C-methylase UbiE